MQTILYWLERRSPYLALLVAWVAMSGSLYFSEVAGYQPCTLCWYQRILMYPLAGIIAIGILRRDHHLPVFVLPLSLLGIGIATYHYLLEKTDLFSNATVCQAGVSCTTVWINWLGFITIPFLSLSGFLLISILMAIAFNAGEPADEPEAERVWPIVGAIIALVVIVFGTLAWINWPEPVADPPFSVLQTSSVLGQSLPTSPTTGLTEPQATGARLYSETCAACHGPQAGGVPTLGTALATSEFVANQDDAALLAFIRAGRAANDPATQTGLAMPPSGGRPNLTDDQLLAIIQFLRTLTPP